VNFWEERDAPGHQRHVRWLARETGLDAAGRPSATLVELLHWIADKDKALADTAPAALLIEKRTLRVSVDEKSGEVAVDWQGDFEVGPAAERVQLHGSEYNGIGLRLPESWDRVAVHENSTRQPLPNTGKRNVLPARWTSTTKGGATMVALFGHSANARGEAHFFTMLEPFAYLAGGAAFDGKNDVAPRAFSEDADGARPINHAIAAGTAYRIAGDLAALGAALLERDVLGVQMQEPFDHALKPAIRVLPAKVGIAGVEVDADGRAFHEPGDAVESVGRAAVLLVAFKVDAQMDSHGGGWRVGFVLFGLTPGQRSFFE
jgi:hypothetical protein